MKVFITGGAGFIGTHLCKKLLSLNHEITVYDNFTNSSQENFSTTIKNNINIILGDILDFSKLESSMKNYDIVIHLAAKINIPESIKNPKLTFDTNVQGTVNVLNSCMKNNIKKIIAASSAAVYQNISANKILNETSTLFASSPYGKSKLEMEKKINDFDSKSLCGIILRLFNVYGSDQSPEYAGVITKFKERIQHNSPLIIYGDGSATRDFIHIDDVTDAIILAMNYTENLTCNIASGTSVNISDLAKTMINLSEKELKILFESPREGDILYSVADITLAKTNLGFLPKVSLKSGLDKLLSKL